MIFSIKEASKEASKRRKKDVKIGVEKIEKNDPATRQMIIADIAEDDGVSDVFVRNMKLKADAKSKSK